MLWQYLTDPTIVKIVLGIPAVVFACVVYTYYKNQYRKENDPAKNSYHSFAVILSVITPFPLLFGAILLFILRAILFASAVTLFTVLVVALRKPFLFILLDKFATKIGDPLLKINTQLIQFALSLWMRRQRPRTVF